MSTASRPERPPETTSPPAQPRWHRVGYWLTAAWFVLVLLATGGARAHPLMDVIFVVPLAGWIAAVGVDAWRRRGRVR